jgi:hypothetical protein
MREIFTQGIPNSGFQQSWHPSNLYIFELIIGLRKMIRALGEFGNLSSAPGN